MIPQSFIDDLQAKIDISEVISNYIPIKRAGRNFKALCPFHNEKTPSFVISPAKQIFHCFGCQAGGGAIQFVMLHEKVSFVEAIEILATKVGLEVPHQKQELNKLKNHLYDAVTCAVEWYHKNLFENKSFDFARKYLERRGITGDVIKQFHIGYAPGRNTALDFLRRKNFTLETLEKASLVMAHNQGYRDLFNERIMFPIFDIRSRAIGFGGRIPGEAKDIPKYINSPENVLYSKRDHLFGFNFSKEDIVREDHAIVVEGYLDMIIPFAAGIKNIVASLGTALTIEQITLLRRYTNNVTVLFDSDKAGQLATMRSIDLLLEQDVNVRIVQLPTGFDPDTLVRSKGKIALTQLISGRLDFFDYKMSILKRLHDSTTIQGKTAIVNDLFATIAKLKSEVAKYEYINKLSQALSIKEEVIIAEYRKFFPQNRAVSQNTAFNAHNVKIAFPLTEKVILKFILHNYTVLPLVKKNLVEEDFTFPLARKVIAYFFSQQDECAQLSFSTLLSSIADKEMSSFISSLLLDEDTPLDKEAFKGSILKLKEKRLKGVKIKLKAAIKEAENQGDKEKLKLLVNQFCNGIKGRGGCRHD